MPKTIGLSLALLVVSSAAIAKQNASGHHHTAPSVKAKPASPPARARTAKKAPAPRRSNAHRHHASHSQHGTPAQSGSTLPPPDRYIAPGPVRVLGGREIGRAAWYGLHHVGRRTSSGEPLDAVHATAAHRSLPLNSLVRVTNLNNGRSVIAKINDRGPVSRSLLIDVSPRAAQELDMIQAGIVDVAVELVAPAAGSGSSSVR
jgi:rare lipoprotein A